MDGCTDHELTQEQIEAMVRPVPGDFVVYLLTGRRMKVLFFSDSILSSFGVSADEFRSAVKEDAFNIVMPADRTYVLSSVFGKPVGPDLIHCRFRLMHREKGFFWVHARSRIIGTMNGCSVILSNYLNASTEAESYSRILDDTASAFCTVDLNTNEILYANQAARALARVSRSDFYAGYPCYSYFYLRNTVCEDCPMASLPSGQRTVLERFDRTCGRWNSVEYKRVAWQGHDCLEICSNDITVMKQREAAEKEEIERFQHSVEGMLAMNPNALCSFQINLTRNRCSVGHGASEYIRRLLQSNTADGLLANIVSIIPDPEQRRKAAGIFDRMNLLNSFRSGKTSFSLDYMRSDEHGKPFWVRTYINMLQNPETLETIGIFYSLDISGEKLQMEKKLVDTIGSLPANYVLYREDSSGALTPERYSDEFCRMKGCTQENIRTFNSTDGFAPVHPEDRDALIRAVQACRDDNQMHHAEYRIRTRNSGYKWVSTNYTFFTIGSQKYLYAVYTDIDVLKKQEKQLEEQYNTAMTFLDSVSGSYLATQRINLTRDIIESTGGADPLDMKSQSVDYDVSLQVLLRSMPRSTDRSRCAEQLSRASLVQAFAGGERSRSVEYMVLLPDSNVNWVRENITLAKRPDSRNIIAFAAVSDINEEKLTGEIMSSIVSKQFDYISCINANTGRLVLFFSNRTRPDMNHIQPGMDYDEIVKQYNSRYVYPGQREDSIAFMKLANVRKALMHSDRIAATFSGDEGEGLRIAQIEYFWLDQENGLIVQVRTDITEAQRQQVEHEKALRTALKAAEDANRAKSDFLSRMSHDIRTPLNGIIGMTYLTGQMELPAEARANLAKIDTSSKFLLGLINDVLDMSKAESGRLELHPEPYNEKTLGSYLDAVIAPLCREKNIAFQVDIDSVPGIDLMLDPLRVNQIFFNLLSNAVKFTPEGGTVTCRLQEERLSEQKVALTAQVTDTGIGISEEFQNTMFEAFTQENRKDTSEGRGTGLGLAIVKKIMDAMGGTIQVKSRINEGTTFTLQVNVDCVPAAGSTGEPRETENSESDDTALLSGKHVLLCEDHPLNQEIAAALLKQRNMIVSLAEDGLAGTELFRQSTPDFYDIILMDVRMPVMDGYEAARAIGALDRPDAGTVPILAMTADAFADDVQRCLDAGMNGHIAKPIDPKQMYEKISSAIRERKH